MISPSLIIQLTSPIPIASIYVLLSRPKPYHSVNTSAGDILAIRTPIQIHHSVLMTFQFYQFGVRRHVPYIYALVICNKKEKLFLFSSFPMKSLNCMLMSYGNLPAAAKYFPFGLKARL